MRIPLVAQRQIPSRDLPYPIAPQEWRFKQSVDYSMSFNRGVLDYASRNRENLLFNIYKMGQRAIERGSGDYWTPSPSRINALPAAGGRGGTAEADAAAWAALRKPELRDPRAFVIPSNQPRLPDRGEVHQRAARGQRHRASRDGGVPGGRQVAIPPDRSSSSPTRRFART